MLKKYTKFLKEASIEDNPSIPPEYRGKIEREEKARLGVISGDRGQDMGLMANYRRSQEMTMGKEEELSEAAKDVIVSIYGDLLKRYHVSLEIELVNPNKVDQFMQEKKEKSEEDSSPEMETFREITDEDVKNEIHKRKISNLITQGKAKDIKKLLDNNILIDKIEEIYGEEKSKEILRIWRSMCESADKLDWLTDTKIRAKMMEENPEGFAGASYVDWKPKEEDETEEEYKEWTGEESEDDMFDMEMEEVEKTPVVKAVGVDFPMLLHEAVKGIFQLLGLEGLPEEESVARTVLMNTGLTDEPEDWKYGPRIAKDLYSFLNENERIDEIPNLREEFFRTLLDRETMETKDFLELFKGILTKTPEARAKVDSMIDDLINDLDYDNQIKKYEEDMKEYERKMKEWEASQKSPSTGEQPSELDAIRSKPRDYSSMSSDELDNAIIDAYSRGDKETVKAIETELSKR
jgi:hypothetical protein